MIKNEGKNEIETLLNTMIQWQCLYNENYPLWQFNFVFSCWGEIIWILIRIGLRVYTIYTAEAYIIHTTTRSNMHRILTAMFSAHHLSVCVLVSLFRNSNAKTNTNKKNYIRNPELFRTVGHRCLLFRNIIYIVWFALLSPTWALYLFTSNFFKS